MGTRSLTVFIDASWEQPKELVVMYRQFDGYPSGHGKDLHSFLKGMRVVNGIRMDEKEPFANGAGCLAAQVIAHFKKDAQGGYYVHAAGTRGCGSEYVYFVTAAFNKPIHLRVEGGYRDNPLIYDGPLDAFDPDCEKEAA